MQILIAKFYIEDYYEVEEFICVGDEELVGKEFRNLVRVQCFKALKHVVTTIKYRTNGKNSTISDEEDYFHITIYEIDTKTGRKSNEVIHFSVKDYASAYWDLYKKRIGVKYDRIKKTS